MSIYYTDNLWYQLSHRRRPNSHLVLAAEITVDAIVLCLFWLLLLCVHSFLHSIQCKPQIFCCLFDSFFYAILTLFTIIFPRSLTSRSRKRDGCASASSLSVENELFVITRFALISTVAHCAHRIQLVTAAISRIIAVVASISSDLLNILNLPHNFMKRFANL